MIRSVFTNLVFGLAANSFCWVSNEAIADLDDELQEVPAPTSAPKTRKTPKDSKGPIDLGIEHNVAPIGLPNSDLETPPLEKNSGVTGTGEKPARQKAGDSSQSKLPINFSSQGALATKDPGVIELKKDVVVTQGDTRLEAEYVKSFMEQSTNEPIKIVASGNVRIFKDDVEPAKKMRATSNEAVFYNRERRIFLRGNPKLWRGNDLIRGKEITYELDTGWVKVDRVEGVIIPDQSNSKPQNVAPATKTTPTAVPLSKPIK